LDEKDAAALPYRRGRLDSSEMLPGRGAGEKLRRSAAQVSVPADIRGGNAVAEERPSGLHDALSVRKKGKCFYCFDDIGVQDQALGVADVDHFFPHVLKSHGMGALLDGVWNLVLACQGCNRGPDGKFARLSRIRHLERLHRRNEYLIDSHHPLRETLIGQTGDSEPARRAFLQETYRISKTLLIHEWEPRHEHEPIF
jgi:hypothetical protein